VLSVRSEDAKEYQDMFIASVAGSDDDGFDLHVQRVDHESGARGWGQNLQVTWMQPPIEENVLGGVTPIGNSRLVGHPHAVSKQIGVCFPHTFAKPPLVFATISDTSDAATAKDLTFTASVGWVNKRGFGANVMAFDKDGKAHEWTHEVMLNWIVPDDTAEHTLTPPSGTWPRPFSAAANLMYASQIGTSHAAKYKSTTVCFGNTYAYDSQRPIIIATVQHETKATAAGATGDLFATSVGWTCSPKDGETSAGGNCDSFNLNTIRVPSAAEEDGKVASWGQQLEVNWLSAPVQKGIKAGTITVGAATQTQRANAKLEFKFANGFKFSKPPMVLVTVHNELGTDHPDVFAASVNSVSENGFGVSIARLDEVAQGWGQDVQVNWMVIPEADTVLYGRAPIGSSDMKRYQDIFVPVNESPQYRPINNRYVVGIEAEPSTSWFDVFTATVLNVTDHGFHCRIARVDNCVEDGMAHPCGWGQEATLVWMALPIEFGFPDMTKVYVPGYVPGANSGTGSGDVVPAAAWTIVVIIIASLVIVIAIGVVVFFAGTIIATTVLPAMRARNGGGGGGASGQAEEGLMTGFAEEGTLAFFDDTPGGAGGGMEASETQFAVMDDADGDVL